MAKDIKTIVIGSDHRGFALKEFLRAHGDIGGTKVTWVDVGAFDDERSDYPTFAIEAVATMQKGAADCGVLICGNGIGMAIAANRYPGVFAGVAWNREIATSAKEDDNVNVLVFPSDYVSNEQALAMLGNWLHAEFKEGRYQRRLAMIRAIVRE